MAFTAPRYSDLDNCTVIVSGTPYKQENGKMSKKDLTEENVFWLKNNINEEWIACLQNPISKKLKKISV